MNNKTILTALLVLILGFSNAAFGQVKSAPSALQPTLSTRGPSDDPQGALPLPVFVTEIQGKTASFRIPAYQTGIQAEYIWDFGDGNQSVSAHPDQFHTFSSYGSYQVSVLVISGTEKASFSAPVRIIPQIRPTGQGIRPVSGK